MDLTTKPPYDRIDFKYLAENDPNFATIYHTSSGHLDFHDPLTVAALSRAILATDFELTLDLPPNRLCPPIPNRWNYVSWLQRLLDSTSPSYSCSYDPDRAVVGLDIGTGASAIYTMLSLRSRPSWRMCATDIDTTSFASAARNLALNGLLSRTKLLQTTRDMPLIPLSALAEQSLDFLICNPPFFVSPQEMRASLAGAGKSARPNAVCTGAEVEMVCEGGDLGFVMRMVDESTLLRERVRWYTSLLGKLESARAVVGLLKKVGVTNWVVGVVETGRDGERGRGRGTRRWIVGWSFGDLRPCNELTRPSGIAHEYLPFPTLYTIPFHSSFPFTITSCSTTTKPSSQSTSSAMSIVTTTLNALLTKLDLTWTWDPAASAGTCEAKGNVWSRAYRRAKARGILGGEGEEMDVDGVSDGVGGGLAVRICVRASDATKSDEEGRGKWEKTRQAAEDEMVVVEIRWLKGTDRVLFESFCGMVHRAFKT